MPAIDTDNGNHFDTDRSSANEKKKNNAKKTTLEIRGYIEDKYIPPSPDKPKKREAGRIKIRYDSFGNKIMKKSKKHKVAFQKDLELVTYVDSYKKYNKPNFMEGFDDDDEKRRGPCRYCVIF